MFTFPGNLLRAYVMQQNITILLHLLRARGGASSAMTTPSGLETITSRGIGP